MKKIISGLFFRFIRSLETWVFLALLVAASAYLFSIPIKADLVPGVSLPNEGEKSFIEMDIPARDVYRLYLEPLPEDTFTKLCGTNNSAHGEYTIICTILTYSHIIPAILMMGFIPLFFGRLFSDNTIKNLISSGHSKAKIYLASLVFTVAVCMLMLIAQAIVFAALCVIYLWIPPIYFPAVILKLFVDLFFISLLSSVCLVFLFTTTKKTVAFIIGFLLLALLSTPLSHSAINRLRDSRPSLSDTEEYKEIWNRIKEDTDQRGNRFEEKIDLLTFDIRTYYQGEEMKYCGDSTLPAFQRAMYLTEIYLDPTLIVVDYLGEAFGLYLLCRDGLMAINIAANIFWITLISAAGIFVFNKREIHG